MASAAESVPAIEDEPTLWWDLLVGILPFAAVLPMLVFEASDLWSREYLRFVPLTLIAAIAIVGVNWRQATATKNPYRRWMAIGILIVGVVVYLISVWQFSPWLSHLALVLAYCAWALGKFGNLHWAAIAAWTALLSTTLRLPDSASSSLLNGLQSSAAWAATKALDALGIPCINSGMLIETRGLSLMADEVCGGWASLFAYVSFAMLLVIVQKRSAVVAAIVLLLVPVWTFLSNFLRLLSIALTYEYSNRNMSVGWDFRLLELATAGLILVLIWMSTYLFTRLLEPIPVADVEFGPIFSALNKLFLWPLPDPIDNEEPDDVYEKKVYLRRKMQRESKAPTWSPFHWQSNLYCVWVVRLAAILLVMGAIIPLNRLFSKGLGDLNFGLPRISRGVVESYAQEESLPAKLSAGWQRTHFDLVQRSPRSGFGEYGLIWVYAMGEKRFSASIDLPFMGWHDPVAQRQLQGWKVEAEKAELADDWVWCEAEMENELGGRSYALYALYTREGEPFSRLPARLAANQAESLRTLEINQEQTDTQITFQFQVFIESGERLSLSDQQRVRESFLELRKIARNLSREVSVSETSGDGP